MRFTRARSPVRSRPETKCDQFLHLAHILFITPAFWSSLHFPLSNSMRAPQVYICMRKLNLRSILHGPTGFCTEMQLWCLSVGLSCRNTRYGKFKFSSITLRASSWIVNRCWYRTRSIGPPLILRDFWGDAASIVEMLDAFFPLWMQKEGRRMIVRGATNFNSESDSLESCIACLSDTVYPVFLLPKMRSQ